MSYSTLKSIFRILLLLLDFIYGPQFILVRLWNQARIRPGNQPVLINEGKATCSRKQLELFIGFEPTTGRDAQPTALLLNSLYQRLLINFPSVVLELCSGQVLKVQITTVQQLKKYSVWFQGSCALQYFLTLYCFIQFPRVVLDRQTDRRTDRYKDKQIGRLRYASLQGHPKR